MNVFISNKYTAKRCVYFLNQNNPKSKYYCKNELIYTCISEILKPFKKLVVLSGVKTLGLALSF